MDPIVKRAEHPSDRMDADAFSSLLRQARRTVKPLTDRERAAEYVPSSVLDVVLRQARGC